MKKFVKSLLSIILVFAILFGAVPLSGFKGVGSSVWHGLCSLAVSAKEGEEDIIETLTPENVPDNTLASSGKCGQNVYWTFDAETGALTISGEGKMYNYGYSYNPQYGPFYNNTSIKSVTIESGVTSIGDWAFRGCSSLTSIEIPNSVTSIGNGSFSGCSSLTSIEIPDSVTSIGNNAFYGCSSLTSISIGNSVTTLGNYAFYNCSSLTTIEISSSVTSIGWGAFCNCNNLNFVIADDIASWCNIDFVDKYSNPMYYAKIFRTPEEIVSDLVIPDSVKQIKDYAFYNCQFLKSVTIPDSVISIGNSAFRNCSRLLNVYFGDGLETIGNEAFYGSSSLTEIFFGIGLISVGENAFFSGRYGYPDKDNLQKVNVKDITSWLKIDFAGGMSSPLYRAHNLYVNGELAEEITVDGVDAVMKNTFCNCTSIKKVTIGDQVKEIDDNAFANCSNLSSLTLGSNLERIGSYAFLGCNITGAMTIPGNVKTVGYQAFNKNSNITNLNISDGVETIGENAFANCTSIMNVSIPASVTTIGYGAFYKSSQITDVYYAKTKSDWDWLGGTEYFGLDYYKVNVHFSAPCAVSGHTAGDEWVVLIPATKHQTGLAAKQCSVCGAITETKFFSGEDTHDYKPAVTPPTCTQRGYTTYTCSICNDTYVDNYVNAKGHTPGEWVVTLEPTTEKDGAKTCYCSVCGEFMQSAVIPKISGSKVKSVTVSDLSLDYLDITTLKSIITADTGASYTVTYTSSNPSVATVDNNGQVSSVKQSGFNRGSTVIKVTVTDSYGNTVTDTCTVTVQFAWWQWLIKIVLFGWIWY